MINVAIGIQARSTSERLPGKCSMLINGKTMIDRVIGACKSSASFINNGKGDIRVTPCLLVPENDPLGMSQADKIVTFYGPHTDVLTRYVKAVESLNVDYICRITADCPLIPAFVITKHIISAVKHQFDYVSNVEPSVRTAPDGFDCEVISKSMIDWLDTYSIAAQDREHVTTLAREKRPSWARFSNIVGYVDASHLKLSVDTQEDLEFVRTYDQIINGKIKEAKKIGEGFFRI